MGLSRVRRTRRLAAWAGEHDLHFDVQDPYDIPTRYTDFALISCGHSPWTCNVSHGRGTRGQLRAFDYRYEVGHGPRRMTRRYAVVLLETDLDLPEVLLWHDGDSANAPLQIRPFAGRVGHWSFQGDSEMADRICRLADSLGEGGTSFQIRRGGIMILRPLARRKGDYPRWMSQARTLADALAREYAPSPRTREVETDRES
jgi:hypothetical protein